MFWYEKIATTPLHFHWLVRFILLPAHAIFLIITFILATLNLTIGGVSAYALLFLQYIVPFVFTVLIFIGFFNWRKYAWALMIIMSLFYTAVGIIITASYAILFSAREVPAWFRDLPTVYNFSMLWMTIISALLTAACIFIFLYYLKRKQLFLLSEAQEDFPPPFHLGSKTVEIDYPGTEPSELTDQPPLQHHDFSYYPVEKTNNINNFCPNCGSLLSNGSTLCDSCGTKIE